MSDLKLLDENAIDKLAGLVFELASQLHEERARRVALETALATAGALDPAAIEALVDEPAFRDRSRASADTSIRRLMRILEEDGGPEGPLRAEAPGSDSSQKDTA
jgi:hypothetical protein